MNTEQAANTKSRRQGSALVEAAFVLVLGLTLLLGIVDFGRAFLLHQTFVQRVRAGSRYAIVNDWDADATAAANRVRNIIVYNEADTTARTEMGLLGLTPSMVSVTREDAGGAAGDEAADRLTVAISGYDLFLFLPGVAGQYLMHPVTQSIPVESLGETP